MVPKPTPLAVQTVLALESAAKLQLTAVLLVPVTVAVYCTVLGVVEVLTGTDAGDAGEDVTVTRICCCPPPLPGACAMHPAKGSRTDATIRQETAESKSFRTRPSEEQEFIENAGRRREVYSVFLVLSRSI
jgi:hypothetical protein